VAAAPFAGAGGDFFLDYAGLVMEYVFPGREIHYQKQYLGFNRFALGGWQFREWTSRFNGEIVRLANDSNWPNPAVRNLPTMVRRRTIPQLP
jgi:hypothetical protein